MTTLATPTPPPTSTLAPPPPARTGRLRLADVGAVDPPARPRRVMYLSHHARLSGGEISLLALLRTIDRSRIEPIVVVGSDGPLADALAAERVRVVVVPMDDGLADTRKGSLGVGALRQAGKLGAAVGWSRRVARLAKHERVDLIHANTLKADFLGAVAGKLAGVPVLWHVRDRIDDDYLPSPAVRAVRGAARVLPCEVWTNSRASAVTIRPGVADDRLPRVLHEGVTLRGEHRLPPIDRPDGRVVGMVGRLAEWKGQHVFLDAAARVLERHPDTRFRLIGSAMFGEEDYEARLLAQVDRLGLGDRVAFMGYRQDVPEQLADLDVFVHASITGEPFGKVIVEAMAAGCAVVATRGGGVPEIVVDGITGSLVPMNDADAMAEAIAPLLDDVDLARRMAEAGRQRVHARFLQEHVTEHATALYERLFRRLGID
ncbi:MAG: glycosyltransferase family 4 protein [Planctomycetota bacterium]